MISNRTGCMRNLLNPIGAVSIETVPSQPSAGRPLHPNSMCLFGILHLNKTTTHITLDCVTKVAGSTCRVCMRAGAWSREDQMEEAPAPPEQAREGSGASQLVGFRTSSYLLAVNISFLYPHAGWKLLTWFCADTGELAEIGRTIRDSGPMINDEAAECLNSGGWMFSHFVSLSGH